MARIEINEAGFDALRTSVPVKNLVERHASELAARANAVPSTTDPAADEPYYAVEDTTDGRRARYRIHTTGDRSVKHETKTQALQGSL